MIDFQKRLDNDNEYPFTVALHTALHALNMLDINFDWRCATHKMFNAVLACVQSKETGETYSKEFPIEEISALSLEQLHNDVIAWFTTIEDE